MTLPRSTALICLLVLTLAGCAAGTTGSATPPSPGAITTSATSPTPQQTAPHASAIASGPRTLTGGQVMRPARLLGASGGTLLTMPQDASGLHSLTITNLSNEMEVLATPPAANTQIINGRATPDGYLVDVCVKKEEGLTSGVLCAISQYLSDGTPGWSWTYGKGQTMKGIYDKFDIQDGVVVVQYGSTLHGADVATGKDLWSVELAGTIIPNTTTQRAHTVVVRGASQNVLTGISAVTGKQAWQIPDPEPSTSKDAKFTASAFLIPGSKTEWTYSLTDGSAILERPSHPNGTTTSTAQGFLRDVDGAALFDPAGTELWKIAPNAGSLYGFEDALYGNFGEQLVILDAATGKQLAFTDVATSFRAQAPQADYGAVLYRARGSEDGTLAVW